MRKTFTTIKTLGMIDNTLYVIGKFNKAEAAIYAALNNAEFTYYSSIGGWKYTLAHDALRG